MNNFEYDSDDNMSHTDGSDPSSGEDSDVMRYQVSIGIIRIVRRERRRHQGDYEGEDHESIWSFCLGQAFLCVYSVGPICAKKNKEQRKENIFE